ncbi:hypothetical protein NDU88_004768 [Pleurodeles waltl]|uniref:Translation initiation factor IF-2-like n=1 Tax=Pleurodeles waltl TaxID=8319 RepID=A0AAV7V5Z3_PLEWA|nr:hypothetical protein NDU88_004768 [Pleurodeles waltl]
MATAVYTMCCYYESVPPLTALPKSPQTSERSEKLVNERSHSAAPTSHAAYTLSAPYSAANKKRNGSCEPAEGSLTAERPERPRAPARKPSTASQNATPLGTGPGPRPGASRAGGAVRGRRGARERGPGAGAGSSGQEDPTLSRGRDRGAGVGRARASPAPAPPGAARRKKSSPSRDGTHAHPARPWEVKTESKCLPGLGPPPRTSCRPRAAGRPGPGGAGAREGTAAPPDQGRGWASPSRLARLGAARLEPGDSQLAGVETPAADGRRAGGAKPNSTPPRCQVPWPVPG